MAFKKEKEYFSTTQKKVKSPRRCVYEGENKNTEPDLARDIIVLYITCKLGYSAIRHILDLPSDKKIEDVIRQHMFGRKGVDGTIGELFCPGSTTLEEVYVPIIKEIVKKYNTGSDPYIVEMLTTGKWSDDPITKQIPYCKNCGKELDPEWVSCPFCGKSINYGKQIKLF